MWHASLPFFKVTLFPKLPFAQPTYLAIELLVPLVFQLFSKELVFPETSRAPKGSDSYLNKFASGHIYAPSQSTSTSYWQKTNFIWSLNKIDLAVAQVNQSILNEPHPTKAPTGSVFVIHSGSFHPDFKIRHTIHTFFLKSKNLKIGSLDSAWLSNSAKITECG